MPALPPDVSQCVSFGERAEVRRPGLWSGEAESHGDAGGEVEWQAHHEAAAESEHPGEVNLCWQREAEVVGCAVNVSRWMGEEDVCEDIRG